jgi:P-type Ca2+ transporter type 2C
LRKLGKVVAVTGEGINDVPALKAADVGFSMGSGVDAAKNSAKMILCEDNIMSIINAVLWGRNIYANVRKFIQFQLTVNFSALLITFISCILEGVPIFSVVQLLWLNIIMDILAAIALGAERPSKESITNVPYR